jgi:hypothetical protein
VHLESVDPIAAAEWYRDVLGARLEVSAQAAAVQPTRDFYRRPMAIARLDKTALAIYKSAGPLESSRGHRIDHLAFKADLVEVRERTDLRVLNAAGRLGTLDTVMVEGPDRLAIEFVGRPSFRGSRDE